MKRIYVWRDNRLIEITPEESKALPQVMPDIAEFRSPDGKHVSGRTQWREHLKRTGTIELGHADIQAQQRGWQKKQEQFQERLKQPGAREADPPSGEIRPMDKTRLSAEMANKLYNRPSPDRKTMIKLTLDMARDLARRR